MPSISSQLSKLEGASAAERSQGYNALLQQIVSGDCVGDDLVAYVQSITSDSVGVINSRPLLSAFVEQFRALQNNEVKLEAG
jgi:COP9 signalosome complex subunit 4